MGTAEMLLEAGDLEAAASRAYYSLFYTAQALLYEQGLRSNNHSGVHALFGQHFSKPGLIAQKFHRALIDAFDLRIRGDYKVEVDIEAGPVISAIAIARELLATAEQFLAKAT